MFIYTKLLLSKDDPTLGKTEEFEERDWMFNSESVVTARPLLEDDDVPKHFRRHSVVSLLDGHEYCLKLTFQELINILDPGNSSDGNQPKSPIPTNPVLDVSI